ncbi:hypothetical protein [Streptomyces yanii]|uniref:Uncharacterized protein n=1 Tax=Streptomyces yanii TaxID=78510 RepID=A0ABV5RQM6_9ACTN
MADAAYGLWPLVVLNTLLFVVFAASFFHPKTQRDWRAMGAYSAFLVALFTLFARTEAASTITELQSSPPRAPISSRTTRCS